MSDYNRKRSEIFIDSIEPAGRLLYTHLYNNMYYHYGYTSQEYYNTHISVLKRYPVVLVLVSFFHLPLVRAYARNPVQRVFLDPVAYAPYGAAGRVQLVQQPFPGTGHEATARRRTSVAALETLRTHRAQGRGVLAVTLELADHASTHHLQHTDLGLLPAYQSFVLGFALGRRVTAGVPHSDRRLSRLC